MNSYFLGEDWLLLSKTHCVATAKQEFINGCCLARLTDWLLLSKALWLADVEQNSHTGCCLARLTAWQWHSIIYSTTTDNLSNLAAGPLDEFHLVSLFSSITSCMEQYFGALYVPLLSKIHRCINTVQVQDLPFMATKDRYQLRTSWYLFVFCT